MAVSSDGKRRRLRHLLKHDALRRVRWPILKRLGFHAWGDERSSVRGPGVEYAESREYESVRMPARSTGTCPRDPTASTCESLIPTEVWTPGSSSMRAPHWIGVPP